MNAIYRTLTGGIECTVEGGELFVRTCEGHPLVRGPWERSPIDINSARAMIHSQSVEGRARGVCILACLTGDPDPWFCSVTSRSDALQAQLEECLAAEQADRPDRAIEEARMEQF